MIMLAGYAAAYHDGTRRTVIYLTGDPREENITPGQRRRAKNGVFERGGPLTPKLELNDT